MTNEKNIYKRDWTDWLADNVALIVVLVVLGNLVFWGTLAGIAWHFIAKLW